MTGIFLLRIVGFIWKGKKVKDMKKGRLIQGVVVLGCMLAMCIFIGKYRYSDVNIEENDIPLSDLPGVLVENTKDDINIIPDKYNTGTKGDLFVVGIGDKISGIQFAAGSGSTRNVLDFSYRNKNIEGTVIFKNIDFSNHAVWMYHEDEVTRKIKVIFENCKFSGVVTGKGQGNISYEFNNCTIRSFSGSNAVFNYCKFGGGYKDGLVPFQNVEVNDSFFCDMASECATGPEVHTDGTQIYGVAGIDVKNVSFDNCRFEIPGHANAGSTAYINACIMLQLEYSNANKVNFTNCIVNGGGYSIYAWDKKKGYTFDDVKFSGIRSGCAKTMGTLYHTVSPGITIEDIEETDSIYIGSVWKENGSTHFSVTNDTNQKRKLMIYTDKGEYEYIIPACPEGAQLKQVYSYSDFPFDIDIVIPENCSYAVCYDATIDGYAKQVRYVNWSENAVYMDADVLRSLSAGGDDVIVSGTCGKNIEFTITKAGELTLSGEGATYSYTSAKLSPWTEYNGFIKKIKVEEGITKLGPQLFRNCNGVQEVSLPIGLTVIDQRAFAGCSSLTSVTLPSTIERLGGYVFNGTALQNVYLDGVLLENVEVGEGNTSWLSKIVEIENEVKEAAVIMQGMCGNNVSYVLTDDGVLKLKGTGATFKYTSTKTAPWYDLRTKVETVVIEEGIETLGDQLFRKCSNLKQVELPNGLRVISNNCFISCSSLQYVEFPRSLKEIRRYAFSGTNILYASFNGTTDEWNEVIVGEYNSVLNNKVYVAKK